MYVEYFLIYVHGRLIILEKKKLPWTTLLVTGRLLVFHFLLSIKDLKPKLFSSNLFGSIQAKCVNANLYMWMIANWIIVNMFFIER